MEANADNLEQENSQVARDQVLRDLKALAHDSEVLLKATAGDVSEKAKEARAKLTAALERSKVTLTEWQDKAKVVAQKTDTVIRAHPYESIGIAFGVGLLIGVLVTRK